MKTYKGSQKFSHIKALLKKSSMELSRVRLKGKWSLEVTSSRRAQLSSGTMRSYNLYISKRVDKLNHFELCCWLLWSLQLWSWFQGCPWLRWPWGQREQPPLLCSGSSSRQWDPTCPALGSASRPQPSKQMGSKICPCPFIHKCTHFRRWSWNSQARNHRIRRETVSQSLPLHAVADVLVTRVENSFNVLRSKVSLNMKDNPLYV